MINREDFEKCWDTFAPTLPLYKTKDETNQWSVVPVHKKLRQLAEAHIEKNNAGIPSVSAFQVVLHLLVQSGDFVPVVATQERTASAEVAELIRKYENHEISTYEFRRQYMTRKDLRDAYDRHTGLAQLAEQASAPLELTVEQYRSIPVRQAQLRYTRDPRFKAAVDRLIAKGRI